MDNKLREELNEIQQGMRDISGSLNDINRNINSHKGNTSFWRTVLAGIGFVAFLAGSNLCKEYEETDKVLLYNGDNAIIFDKEDDALNSMFLLDCSIIYIDEDKGISANDIAVSLVGEDGNVYYYNSETKKMVLINQK